MNTWYITGEIEDAMKRQICDALIKRGILPVSPESAVDYCLRTYSQECNNNELIQIIEDGYYSKNILI